MNPWLETHWESVSASAATFAADQMSVQLPPGLVALHRAREVVEPAVEDVIVLDPPVERNIEIVLPSGQLITG